MAERFNRKYSKQQKRRLGWKPHKKGGPRKLTDAQQKERRDLITAQYPHTKVAKAKQKRILACENAWRNAHKRKKNSPRFRRPIIVPPEQTSYGSYGTSNSRW